MIDLNELRDNVLKSEGYAQGFKDGYASCAKFIVDEMTKEKKPIIEPQVS